MKIVLAYSGGLDTSVIVKWLEETYDAEIVTFAADIGQEEELKGLPAKARKTGARQALHARSGRGVRPRLHLPDDPGQRDLRGPVLSRHLDRAPAHRQGADRHRAARKRPTPSRTAPPARATTSAVSSSPTWRSRRDLHDHRAVEDRGLPREVSRPRRDDRLLPHAPDSRSRPRSRSRIRWTAISCTSPTRPASSRIRGSIRPRKANKGMFKLSVSPEDAPEQARIRRARFRAGQLRRGEREETLARRRAQGAQQARRQARHRPRRPGREPLRRHEVARRLRDARRHDPHAGATGRSSR